MTNKRRDMLVAAPERWDEACFAVPAVRALQAAGLEVGVLCREEQRDFWHTVAGLEVLAFAVKEKARIAAGVIRGSWQAALLWEPGFAADAIKLADVPRRLGPGHRPLLKRLTHPLGVVEQPLEHRVRYYLATLEEIGIATSQPEFFAPLASGPPAPAAAVLLSPDSDFGPSYEWPLPNWLEIARQLLAEGRPLAIATQPGGRALGIALARELGARAGVLQASPLGGVLPALAGFRLVLAADGSLPHLAAHLGAICVTLFGPNDPQWKRPLGRRHAVVRRHVECAPCLLARCPLDARCQGELETARVWAALRAKLP